MAVAHVPLSFDLFHADTCDIYVRLYIYIYTYIGAFSVPLFQASPSLYTQCIPTAAFSPAIDHPVTSMSFPVPPYAQEDQAQVNALWGILKPREDKRAEYARLSKLGSVHYNPDLIAPKNPNDLGEWNNFWMSRYSVLEAVENPGKNRFAQYPYEFSGVRTTLFSKVAGKARFVSMSAVPSLIDGRIIYPAQAPLRNTVHAFLCAIMERGVKVVVMLTKLEDAGGVKADLWFPMLPTDAEMFYEDDESDVKLGVMTKDLEEPDVGLTKRVLTVKVYKQGEVAHTHQITHFWYHGWPDFGVPDKTSTILNLIGHMHQANITPSPSFSDAANSDPGIVVHCSAGVGRTGTFMACQNCLAAAGDRRIVKYEGRPSDIPPLQSCVGPLPEQYKAHLLAQIIDHSREYRGGLVQTAEQAHFVVQVVRDAASAA